MEWLWGTPRHPHLAPVEGDDVYPTHFMDNKSAFETILFATTWHFNDVLDAGRLHTSLCQLLDIGDWRKLGGRFRRAPGQRTWEIHVPKQFTQDRPSVTFTHENFGMKLEEHPLATHIPRSSTGPSFHASPEVLRPLVARPDVPETMNDYLSRDEPALSLHVTSFDDATLVSLAWPHNLMDIMGLKTLIQAWSLVLAGREGDVPSIQGAHHDILYENANLDLSRKEESVLDRDRLGGFRMVIFALHFLWDIIWNRIEARILFLPKATMEKLHAQALDDISASAKSGADRPWISESDTLLATWTKGLAQSLPRPRPIISMNPFDMRGRAPGFTKSEDTAYVQNVVTECLTTIPPSLASSSIGQIALACRRSLQEQTSSLQILALLRSLRQLWDSGKEIQSLSGPPNAALLVTTNWGRARLFHVADFGPAVVRQGEGDESRTNPPGSCRFYATIPLQRDAKMRNSMTQLGKDRDGNIWVMGLFNTRTWDCIQDMIA